MQKPLGIRNCNPGNIERNGIAWRGTEGVPQSGRFVTFESMPFGIRAAGVLITNYHRKHGIRTIRGIISRWAPYKENNTEAYIRSVALHSGLPVDRPMKLDEEIAVRRILRAIFRHENGLAPGGLPWISPSVFEAGINLLYGRTT